jgi:DNA replication and repair protein RecF
LLHGANAQGKTNLLEAIYYLATTRSPHADQDQELIHWEALNPEEPVIVGRLTAQLETIDGSKQIEMRLIKEQQRGQVSFRRQALIDRRKVRLMDLLGSLRTVLFLPQDVQIITGSPAQRRRYLDITLCQTDRQYCRALSAYNKVLEQRNAQLRRIAEFGTGHDVLPVFTEELVKLGSQIFAARAGFIAAIDREARAIHFENLTDGQETLRLRYLPRLTTENNRRGDDQYLQEPIDLGQWLETLSETEAIEEKFASLLDQVQPAEIAGGSTRVGPHRDDWRFWVSGKSLSTYGSRGQQRTALLALKLAEIAWMEEQTGETPILLLDEVVAELDEHRRAHLLNTVQNVNQAILTATDPGMFTKQFVQIANMMQVKNGQIIPEKKEPE